MTFNSLPFLVLFSVVSVLLALTNIKLPFKKDTVLLIRHIILLAASYVFYGWWNWKFAFLMLALTAIAYFCSILLEKTGKKIYLYIGVVVPLVILGIFKYFNFFVQSFATAFGIQNVGVLNIILPVGISFYTFQSLSYTIDVHSKKVTCEKSFIKLALYISFFPQLVAGPIVKASDFIHQLYEDRNINVKGFKEGIQIFLFGLIKKIVLADNIAICVDAVFAAPENFHAVSVFAAAVGYSIQIYFDFSGYSDMAIGCAKCLGYDLMRNFNLPYVSRNVTELWKRWHISLSTWLQEYLYISMGGNRKGKLRTNINLFLTMVIGGLWHGAAWTYVVWGALHGLALGVHKLWMRITGHGRDHKGTLIGNLLSGLVTFLFVMFCFVIFRADSFSTALKIITAIFTWQNGVMYISSWVVLSVILLTIGTLAAFVRSKKKNTAFDGFYPIVNLDTVGGQIIFFVALGLCIMLAYTGTSPFIYFQF